MGLISLTPEGQPVSNTLDKAPWEPCLSNSDFGLTNELWTQFMYFGLSVKGNNANAPRMLKTLGLQQVWYMYTEECGPVSHWVPEIPANNVMVPANAQIDNATGR